VYYTHTQFIPTLQTPSGLWQLAPVYQATQQNIPDDSTENLRAHSPK